MEMHVTFLSRKLKQRGHRLLVICSPDSPLENDLRESGLETYPFKLFGYFHPFAILKLHRFVRQKSVDIIHSHYSRDLWTIVPALALGKDTTEIPLILTKHIGTGRPKRDWPHRRIYRHVNFLIAISEVIRQNLIATHPISPSQVGVVHHGIDLQDFSNEKAYDRSLRAEWGFSGDHIVFGMIGRLQIGKGYMEFLEMAQRLAAQIPRAKFLMVGEATRGEPEEANAILQRLGKLRLEQVVKWVGFRKDIPRVLAAMDVFVFPSHAEAFGMVVIEAMAARKPIIASKSDGILDIIAHNQTGILVPPRDVETLFLACRSLAMDRDLRDRLAGAARRAAEERFSADRMLDEIEAIYDRLQKSS
jgi:glycosyltransferase involved in cell wall biosynthesis